MGKFSKRLLGPNTKKVLTDPNIGWVSKKIFDAVATDYEQGAITKDKLPFEVFRANAIAAVYLFLAPGVAGAKGLARLAGMDEDEVTKLHIQMKRALKEAFDDVWVVAAKLEERGDDYH